MPGGDSSRPGSSVGPSVPQGGPPEGGLVNAGPRPGLYIWTSHRWMLRSAAEHDVDTLCEYVAAVVADILDLPVDDVEVYEDSELHRGNIVGEERPYFIRLETEVYSVPVRVGVYTSPLGLPCNYPMIYLYDQETVRREVIRALEEVGRNG